MCNETFTSNFKKANKRQLPYSIYLLMNFSRRKSRQSLTGGEICYCVNCDFRNIMSRYTMNSGMNET